MKTRKLSRKQDFSKAKFGSVYTVKGSQFLYVSFYYFKERLRFPTDRIATETNRQELVDFLNEVGDKIRRGTFCLAKSFPWLDEPTKQHFAELEGREVLPEPEYVTFGEYAEKWMQKKLPTFASVTKQRDYREALTSRLLPHFAPVTFAGITATVVESFIDNLQRVDRTKSRGKGSHRSPGKPLSVKRIKNILGPMSKVWVSACNEYNWNLRSPFIGVAEKYKELADRAIQEKERQIVVRKADDVADDSQREVFLCAEWEKLISCLPSHYHLVAELLLMGMIGSELEALQQQHVADAGIQVRCAVVRDKDGKAHYKFKPKNWYRKRQIPLTMRLRRLLARNSTVRKTDDMIEFANNIELPASQFVLSMVDGSPFNYNSFRKTVWDKAVTEAGLEKRVPYCARHTLVQWALLIGISKNRLVDLMGHSNKNMIDRVYGQYRQGLVEEREVILDYLGDDFLALEELKVAFPERYQRQMAQPDPQTAKAPVLAATFGQSFGQSQRLYADNYLKWQ